MKETYTTQEVAELLAVRSSYVSKLARMGKFIRLDKNCYEMKSVDKFNVEHHMKNLGIKYDLKNKRGYTTQKVRNLLGVTGREMNLLIWQGKIIKLGRYIYDAESVDKLYNEFILGETL